MWDGGGIFAEAGQARREGFVRTDARLLTFRNFRGESGFGNPRVYLWDSPCVTVTRDRNSRTRVPGP